MSVECLVSCSLIKYMDNCSFLSSIWIIVVFKARQDLEFLRHRSTRRLSLCKLLGQGKRFMHSNYHSEPQSGPKVLVYSGIFISDFLCSPFSMLIHTTLAQTPLLSATLRQGVGRVNSILRQEFGIMIPSYNVQKLNFSAVNR